MYTHKKKTHRCTAQNDSNDSSSSTGKFLRRSEWEKPGITAISPSIGQTAFGNKVFAATK
ncbi:MAG: hypothetical protein RSD36_10010 [Terrisporobacter sp.]